MSHVPIFLPILILLLTKKMLKILQHLSFFFFPGLLHLPFSPPSQKKRSEVSTIKVSGNVLIPLGAGGISDGISASAAEGTKAVIRGKDELPDVTYQTSSDFQHHQHDVMPPGFSNFGLSQKIREVVSPAKNVPFTNIYHRLVFLFHLL